MLFSSITVFPLISILCLLLYAEKHKVYALRSSLLFYGWLSFAAAMILDFALFSLLPKTLSVYEYDKTEIIPLSSTISINGKSFLVSEQVHRGPSYFFYLKTTDGGKQLATLPVGSVTIHEEDRKDAFLVKVAKTWKFHRSALLDFFMPPMGPLPLEYVIHLPKGSVEKEIRLDLQ